MSTNVSTTEEVTQRDLEELIAKLMRGEPRDPEAVRRVCERMDRMREKTFKRVGLLDVAVPYIRISENFAINEICS